MDLLARIVKLSHAYGTADYVKGGGGNTSVKNDQTLWIKPSGTTLGGLTEESFVPLRREILNGVRQRPLSSNVKEREEQAKDILFSAIEPGRSGRPSVETMLHNAFSARFVVHTHPSLVNGLTCGVNGKAAAAKLFPGSVWIEYTDPGYILFLRVDDEIKSYRAKNGKEPDMVFLENHGVFIAGNSESEIDAIYNHMMQTLKKEYDRAGIKTTITAQAPTAAAAGNAKLLAEILNCKICISGNFPVASGPLTPDHIVYAKSFPFCEKITRENLDSFKARHGYAPVISCCGGDVFAAGASDNRAALALELALDGALVSSLCAAFGGVRFMSDAAREFIENWEVESYRSAMIK